MVYADVFQVSVKFDLKFVIIVSANNIDSEWEFGNDVIHEVNCILLCMSFVNLQCPDACRIVNCCVLEVPYLATFLSFKIKEFHIDLHVMPGYLLFIADCLNRPFALPIRQVIQIMALRRCIPHPKIS